MRSLLMIVFLYVYLSLAEIDKVGAAHPMTHGTAWLQHSALPTCMPIKRQVPLKWGHMVVEPPGPRHSMDPGITPRLSHHLAHTILLYHTQEPEEEDSQDSAVIRARHKAKTELSLWYSYCTLPLTCSILMFQVGVIIFFRSLW